MSFTSEYCNTCGQYVGDTMHFCQGMPRIYDPFPSVNLPTYVTHGELEVLKQRISKLEEEKDATRLTSEDISSIIEWLETKYDPFNTNPDEIDDQKELEYLIKKLRSLK